MRTLVLLILFCGSASFCWAQVIDGQVRWHGEVHIEQNLRVAKGAELIIEPGSRVVASAGIEIAGVLQATDVEFGGSNWPGLVLKGVDQRTRLTNCRISAAQTGITVVGGNPLLSHLRLEGNRVGIELRQKSRARVENSVFSANSRVGLFVKDEATPVVTGNRFEKQGKFGAYIYRALPQSFSENLFVSNPTGLMISHYGSDPQIRANEFRDNQTGIKVDRAARPQIRSNRFTANRVGLELYRRSDPQVELNRFSKNRQAIHVSFSSYPKIRHNDFTGNDRALVLEYQSSLWEEQKGAAARQQQLNGRGAFGGQKQAQVTEEERRAHNLDGHVDARENWWGQKETRQLAGLDATANLGWIVDGHDHPTFEEGGKNYPLDRVRWLPYATSAFTTETSP